VEIDALEIGEFMASCFSAEGAVEFGRFLARHGIQRRRRDIKIASGILIRFGEILRVEEIG
jgi:hypothetical protein